MHHSASMNWPFSLTLKQCSLLRITLKTPQFHTVNMAADVLVPQGATHHGDVIMGTMASQITSFMVVYSTVYSGADQGKHQSSTSLAFVRGIHRELVNSPHKWPVMRKMFSFDDIIMSINCLIHHPAHALATNTTKSHKNGSTMSWNNIQWVKPRIYWFHNS